MAPWRSARTRDRRMSSERSRRALPRGAQLRFVRYDADAVVSVDAVVAQIDSLRDDADARSGGKRTVSKPQSVIPSVSRRIWGEGGAQSHVRRPPRSLDSRC